MAGYSCPVCSVFSPTLKLYVGHLRTTHAKESSFSVLCGVNGCREVFRTFSAFNSHIYRHHRADIGMECATCTTQSPDEDRPFNLSQDVDDGGTDPNVLATDDCNVDGSVIVSRHTTLRAATTDQTLIAAKMLLDLREGHQVSQVALSEVVSGCRLLCNQALTLLKMDICKLISCDYKSTFGEL